MLPGPDATLALLTVAELPRVGERRLERVQERARSRHLPLASIAELPASALREELGLPAPAIGRLQTARAWHEARCAQLAARLFDHGVRVCPRDDPDYPPGWARHGDPPPPLAYLHGAPALLRQPIAALLHSRLVDGGTLAATVRLARAAVGAGYGLAVGGMGTPHRIAASTARALGGARLVVLDRGLLAAFGGDLDRDPFGVGPGRPRFDPARTLVATPFRCEDHAVPRSGRRRDALLAALADVVLAVHARPEGEIERLCLRALARGQVVAVWRAHNRRLVTAGAVPLDESGLDERLARLRAAGVRPASGRRR